ncbi:hypothetical protein QTP88_029904 [Uroleucon formosanum]
MAAFTVNVISDNYVSTPVSLPGETIGGSPEYPSTWFAKNPRQKPGIVLPKKLTEGVIWNKVLGHALQLNVQPNVAILFMSEYIAENYVEVATDIWTSYNVVIANPHQNVTLMDLLRVTSSNTSWTPTEGDEIDTEGKFRLFAMLLAGYRYGLASEVLQGDYKATVLGKINQVLRNEPYNLQSDLTPTELARCKTWYNNSEFRALIAACDMFWTKFPDSIGAKLRVCTLSSRFKDCASISEIRHLSKMSCKSVGEIFRYIFSTRIRDEIIAIGRPGEEFNKEDSYFPYMRELRLSKRSPYSSTCNENLHNWIHFFCALMGSDRSYNARIVTESGLTIMMNLALFAAHAFKKFTIPQMAFGNQDDADGAKEIAGMGDSDSGSSLEIDPASPLGVFKFMTDNDNSVPVSVKEMFTPIIKAMPAPRDKTIGMFLRRNFV